MAGRKRKTEAQPLGRVLKGLMAERKLSIADVARMAGVSKSVAGDWLSGTTPADLLAVKRLADELGVSMAFLVTGERDKANAPTLEDVLTGGDIMEGVFKISVQRLVARTNKRDPGTEGGDK